MTFPQPKTLLTESGGDGVEEVVVVVVVEGGKMMGNINNVRTTVTSISVVSK